MGSCERGNNISRTVRKRKFLERLREIWDLLEGLFSRHILCELQIDGLHSLGSSVSNTSVAMALRFYMTCRVTEMFTNAYVKHNNKLKTHMQRDTRPRELPDMPLVIRVVLRLRH